MNLLPGKDVMPLVARDGIEQHYTFRKFLITMSLTGIRLNPAA